MPDVRAVSSDIQGKLHAGDRELAVLAGRQHGVIAMWQALELGFGRPAIEHRLAVGRLHRVHRGVYAVGHRSAHLAWCPDGCSTRLRAGRRAEPSQRGAAVGHPARLRGGPWTSRSSAAGGGRAAASRCTRVRALDPRDVTRHRRRSQSRPSPGRCSTSRRSAPRDHVARAIEESERKRIFDRRALDELLERSPGRRGTPPTSARSSPMPYRSNPPPAKSSSGASNK